MLPKLKHFFLLLTLIIQATNGFSLDLDVRIYSSSKLSQLSFTPISGKYAIRADHLPLSFDLYKTNTIEFKLVGDKIQIIKNKIVVGNCKEVSLESSGLVNAFTINSNAKKYAERTYDDELRIKVENNSLMLINRVDLEKYVAGVVQSEVLGSSKDLDFFKIQAIIARTYTLTNIMKHMKEGYNLCDETHCQAYYRRCNTPDIMQAVAETFCDVIVDAEGKLISAAFHSNSGGQTQNSEDVWTIQTSYLRSVTDTFSNGGKNYLWETKIPKKKWMDYFLTNYPYIANQPDIQKQLCNFSQETRTRFIVDSIPLRNIRISFNLRSSFFSTTEEKDMIILKGKGYGHGVGLSQEGAIKMVQLGKKAEEVIRHYYTGVNIIKYTEILKF